MKIGLTYTGSAEKHENYVKWLQKEENIEIIKLSVDDNNVDEIRNCDALVLSGGIDIHPKFYGSNELNYPGAPEKFNEKRDEFEMAAFQLAQEKNIPVLGICRGAQVINCILGGNLQKDLGDQLKEVHEGKPDKHHPVHIEEQTLLHEIIGDEKGEINSAHHQAIGKLGEGLRVNCRAEDGTPEGIEWTDVTRKPFLLAIQWHPERMYTFQLHDSPLSKNIREKFLEEIRKSKANRK